MIIVSKCFTGECCRYDGKSKPIPRICALVAAGRAVAVCPEQLGGLPTPRVPAELTADGGLCLDGLGRAVTRDGRDVTREYVSGAYAALEAAAAAGATRAYLKAKSPSCGCGLIYDGSFTGTLVPGDGVFAALLRRSGVDVRTR